MTRWLARQLWWCMLWYMRRPFVRKAQRTLINLVPETRRESARANMIKQEKFARRIGRPVLTFVINLFFLSVILTFLLLAILNAVADGWLVIPTQEALNLDPSPSQSPSAPVR